jgi:ribosomal-protein-alanine N-acetyltransferase
LLEVRAGNKAARRLYESTGFRVVGKRPRYYGPGPEGTALVMELKLTSGRRFSEAKGRKVRR